MDNQKPKTDNQKPRTEHREPKTENRKPKIEEEIKYITEQIICNYKPQKIILFGSAVKDNWTKDSDLDFFIIKEDVPDNGLDRMFELRHLIEKNVAADFIICKPEEVEKRFCMGDPFIKMILTKGKVLYG